MTAEVDLDGAIVQRALAAAHGLVLGDALGAPASVHRTIRDPWVRQMLRRGTADLDDSQVLRPVVPFVLSALGTESLVGTDDAELFAVAALSMAGTGSTDELFTEWVRLVDQPDTWLGTAQRSALDNSRHGLVPPQTGQDNPAFYDDTALPGALAAAIAARTPLEAAERAAQFARITHDGVGVHAAVLFAHILNASFEGATIESAIDAALATLEFDEWLHGNIAQARSIMQAAPQPFLAIPELVQVFAPRTYSHAGTVTETLPLAIAITEACGGNHALAMPLAFAVTRHQDSLPGLVGALCGALGAKIDANGTDLLAGVTIPATAGSSITELVRSLLQLRG
ncbi:ADP-ribosylglycohydrolase family protein [Humidisolicoccus flavus]|uniref:ADP-ribosylglycohydrolase family protein n=1 Tax=Humidisolicoccus flavus TaxID=3111414 RepID=UPI003254F8F1